MPLQIRRGTEAERIAMVPKLANGELLWITDAKKLYVGDGVLASSALAPVTGFNAEDAQDAAALLFTTTPTHSNITFAYDDLAGTLTATVNLSNYVGTIKASSFNGSLVADDSTTLVDAISGTFNGNLVGNVTGNTAGIHTGAVVGNVTGNTAGIHTGNVTGDVTGNTEGYHTGDVKGSVFGDDSSVIVDSVSNTINIQTIIHASGELKIGDVSNTTSLLVTSNDEFPLAIKGITDGVGGPNIAFIASKGTLTSPVALVAGDEVGGYSIQITDGTTVKSTAAIVSQIAGDAVMADDNPKSNLVIGVSAGGTNFSLFGFNGNGTFVAPGAVQLAVYANDTARLAAIPTPAKGMMVFMTAGTVPTVTNKTVVYDGSAWVALH
jgi:hypothetical protein